MSNVHPQKSPPLVCMPKCASTKITSTCESPSFGSRIQFTQIAVGRYGTTILIARPSNIHAHWIAAEMLFLGIDSVSAMDLQCVGQGTIRIRWLVNGSSLDRSWTNGSQWFRICCNDCWVELRSLSCLVMVWKVFAGCGLLCLRSYVSPFYCFWFVRRPMATCDTSAFVKPSTCHLPGTTKTGYRTTEKGAGAGVAMLRGAAIMFLGDLKDSEI